MGFRGHVCIASTCCGHQRLLSRSWEGREDRRTLQGLRPALPCAGHSSTGLSFSPPRPLSRYCLPAPSLPVPPCIPSPALYLPVCLILCLHIPALKPVPEMAPGPQSCPQGLLSSERRMEKNWGLVQAAPHSLFSSWASSLEPASISAPICALQLVGTGG